MYIANPIYDTVFKCLMEDDHIARTLTKNGERWVLNYRDLAAITDPDLRAIAQRLAQALYDNELLEKVKVEEEVEGELDKLVRLKEGAEAKAEEALLRQDSLLRTSVLKFHKMGLTNSEIADTLGVEMEVVAAIIG